MTKTVSKVVVYFTDGTSQEVGGSFFGSSGGGAGGESPFGEDIWKQPGQSGVWPFPPDSIGTRIVD